MRRSGDSHCSTFSAAEITQPLLGTQDQPGQETEATEEIVAGKNNQGPSNLGQKSTGGALQIPGMRATEPKRKLGASLVKVAIQELQDAVSGKEVLNKKGQEGGLNLDLEEFSRRRPNSPTFSELPEDRMKLSQSNRIEAPSPQLRDVDMHSSPCPPMVETSEAEALVEFQECEMTDLQVLEEEAKPPDLEFWVNILIARTGYQEDLILVHDGESGCDVTKIKLDKREQ